MGEVGSGLRQSASCLAPACRPIFIGGFCCIFASFISHFYTAELLRDNLTISATRLLNACSCSRSFACCVVAPPSLSFPASPGRMCPHNALKRRLLLNLPLFLIRLLPTLLHLSFPLVFSRELYSFLFIRFVWVCGRDLSFLRYRLVIIVFYFH